MSRITALLSDTLSQAIPAVTFRAGTESKVAVLGVVAGELASSLGAGWDRFGTLRRILDPRRIG